MQVNVISDSEPRLGTIHTLELSSLEIPRQHDSVSFDGVTHTVKLVRWLYKREGRLVMIDGLPPGTIYSIKLVGVNIYV
jgi:hypothetical protein